MLFFASINKEYRPTFFEIRNVFTYIVDKFKDPQATDKQKVE